MTNQLTDQPRDILACVDGSLYADSVCGYAAWASPRLGAGVRLLHVQTPTATASPTDLSGSIGLGARSRLLEELAQVDETRSKLDLQKGKLILAHAKEQLVTLGVANIETLHRRGSLVETLAELDASAQLILLGKRGENAASAFLHLGSNLERVVRAAHKPILVCPRAFKAINRFVIAYDGGASTVKAVDSIASNPLLKGLECQLLHIGSKNTTIEHMMSEAALKLQQSGLSVHTQFMPGHPDEAIVAYVEENGIDLLVMGAYGHSHIRTLIIGSTTSAMLRASHLPVLMFR
jgi:nucleotide-binding universal stress UspA family protein